MATIPFQPVQTTARQEAPRVQISSAYLDMSGFFSGLLNAGQAVIEKSNANASNRGLNKWMAVEKELIPVVRDYQKEHAADPDFDEKFIQFLETEIKKRAGKLQFSNEREEVAFQQSSLQYTLNTAQSGIQNADKVFKATQDAIVGQNIEAVKAGAVTATVSRPVIDGKQQMSGLDSSVAKLAQIYRDASDPEQNGHMNRTGALSAFKIDQRAMMIERFVGQNKGKAILMDIANDPNASIEVYKVDSDLNLVLDKNGLPQRETVLLTAQERQSISELFKKDVTDRNVVEKAMQENSDRRFAFQKKQMTQDAYQRIFSGAVGVAQELNNVWIDEYGPLFDDTEIIRMQAFENSLADARATRRTTDLGRYMQLLRTASDGNLDLAALEAENNISASDLISLAKYNQAEQQRKLSEGYSIYKDRKNNAERILRSFFGVHADFASDPQLVNFLPGIMNEFEARLIEEEDRIRQEGGNLVQLQPIDLANRMIFEKRAAFFKVLVPEIHKQGKELTRWIEFAALEPKPTLATVMDKLNADFKSGRIPPAVYERNLFVLTALHDRGYSFETLHKAMLTGSSKIDSVKFQFQDQKGERDERVAPPSPTSELENSILDSISVVGPRDNLFIGDE